MQNMLDAFNGNAFNVVSMTTAINLLPYKPGHLGQRVQWNFEGVNSDTAVLEYEKGRLQLLQTQARGTNQNTEHSKTRIVKTLKIPHVPQNSALKADDVLGVRAFGSASAMETVSQKVKERLTQHRDNHDVTLEFHRAGAVCGKVLDADGSLILDIFAEFGIAENQITFDFTQSGGVIQGKCRDVVNTVTESLGASVATGVHALVDDQWFDAMMTNTEIRDSYDRWQNGSFFRDGLPGYNEMFRWGGITWEQYRGKIGARNFLNPDGAASGFARFYPVGVPQLFKETAAPADYMETVNTIGKRFYAKQEPMKFDKGREFESQTNVLYHCTRPSTLVKGII